MTTDERDEKLDNAVAEHRRVLPLALSAARHLKEATADLVEIRRIEKLARR